MINKQKSPTKNINKWVINYPTSPEQLEDRVPQWKECTLLISSMDLEHTSTALYVKVTQSLNSYSNLNLGIPQSLLLLLLLLASHRIEWRTMKQYRSRKTERIIYLIKIWVWRTIWQSNHQLVIHRQKLEKNP